MYYCGRGHLLHNTYVDCHECISLDYHNEQKRQNDKYYEYLQSQEYENKCKQKNIRQEKTRQDFINFVNAVYSAIIAILTFIKYLCGANMTDIFHDVNVFAAIVLLNIWEISVDVIHTTIYFIEFMIKIIIYSLIFLFMLIIIVSVVDTLKYYNNFRHLDVKLVPMQFINLFVANTKSCFVKY